MKKLFTLLLIIFFEITPASSQMVPGISNGMFFDGATSLCVTSPTSYSNPNGSGNRSSVLGATITSTLTWSGAGYAGFVNGATSNYIYPNPDGQAVIGKTLLSLDFGTPKVINEVTISQQGVFPGSTGTFVWQGSNDGGVTWANAGTSFVLDQGLSTQIDTSLSANMSCFQKYRMQGISGNARWGYINEFDFKISP